MVCNHRDTLLLMPGITWLIISECLKCLLLLKAILKTILNFLLRVMYFILFCCCCCFLYYDTINNFLSVLILCSSGILALCATLQSKIKLWMNEWMNSGMQIFKFMRHECKLSFPSSLPHPPTPRNPMRACSQTNVKLAALCQNSHIRLNGIYLRASTNDLPLKSCSSTKIRNTSKLKSALWIKINEIIII